MIAEFVAPFSEYGRESAEFETDAFSHSNVILLTECGKKSVFIWHRVQVNVVAMGLVPTYDHL